MEIGLEETLITVGLRKLLALACACNWPRDRCDV